MCGSFVHKSAKHIQGRYANRLSTRQWPNWWQPIQQKYKHALVQRAYISRLAIRIGAPEELPKFRGTETCIDKEIRHSGASVCC